VLGLFFSIPHREPPGRLAHIDGLIWLVPVHGSDGYHWHGFQIFLGDLYVWTGLGILGAAAIYLALTRVRVSARLTDPYEATARLVH
jgi:hypothetical protein